MQIASGSELPNLGQTSPPQELALCLGFPGAPWPDFPLVESFLLGTRPWYSFPSESLGLVLHIATVLVAHPKQSCPSFPLPHAFHTSASDTTLFCGLSLSRLPARSPLQAPTRPSAPPQAAAPDCWGVGGGGGAG